MPETSNRAISFYNVPCTHCQTLIPEVKTHQSYHYRTTGRVFCKPSCGYAYRDARRKPRTLETKTITCSQCENPTVLTRAALTYFKQTGRGYCSDSCRDSYRSQRSSETMAQTNRVHASKRMRERNPMSDPEIRLKMAKTLKRIRHQPIVRGGNGCGMSLAETIMNEALQGLGFTWNYAEKTGMPRGSGFPPCYKIDFAHPQQKIAIEVDGQSHYSRRAIDEKKTALLNSRGWKVLRFSNNEVLTGAEHIRPSITSMLKTPTPTSPTVS